MPDSDGQTEVALADLMPSDLDAFFAWARETGDVAEPVKATLATIANGHREDFEKLFTRDDAIIERAKAGYAEDVPGYKEALEAIEVMERAFAGFAQTFKFGEPRELALVKSEQVSAFGSGVDAPDGWEDVLPLAYIKDIFISQLREAEQDLKTLKDRKKQPSAEIVLLRRVNSFLMERDCDTAQTLEIVRLLMRHTGVGDPKSEKLRKEHRLLLDEAAVPRSRKPRAAR